MPWKLVFFIFLLHFIRIQSKPSVLLCRKELDDSDNKKGFQLQSASSEEKETEIDVLKSQSLIKGIQTEDKSPIVQRHEEFKNTANKIRLRFPSSLEEEKLEIIKTNPLENDVKIQSNPSILRRHEDANKIRLTLPSSLEKDEEKLEILKTNPLEDNVKIESNPTVLLSNEEFDDNGNKIRLLLQSSQEEEEDEKIVNILKTQQLEKEISRFNEENENIRPCKHIIVKCDDCEKRKSLIPRFATNNRDLWNSLAEIESLRPSQNSQFGGGCEMSKMNSPQIRRSTKAEDEEEEKEKQRRKMYEDFLKFTTVLNKIDEFFTKKTKVFVRGLHTMIESSEEDKNGFHNVSR
ncbi:hypothetical protein O3M35_011378 [Rhynocoris fuscipes]|uniref:Uncharacterized protein n=1 Tax=Rhynocoris fuscipes TaxID=488301 RepID=A0AAW1CWE5_9HEMI